MEAIKITDRLRDYMNSHNKQIGQIHSVFNGAFNIIDSEGNLIGILSNEKDLSPLSMVVNTNSFNQKAIVQGNLIEFTKGEIHFQHTKVKINISNAEVIDLTLKYKPFEHNSHLFEKLELLKSLILEKGALTGIGELVKYLDVSSEVSFNDIQSHELNEYCNFIQDRLLELMNSIMEDDIHRFNSAIQKIVGFGPGLTPSTDDFLTGIIIIINYLCPVESKDLLLNINELCAGKTTKISEEMIKHATRGYVPESYKNLIQALFDNDKDDITEVVEKVIQIGSSSGTDFLFGVYCMALINSEKVRRLKI